MTGGVPLPDDVQQMLSCLGPEKRAILGFRFGLHSPGVHTLNETAERFNLTRDQVRSVEAEAMAQLPEEMASADSARLRAVYAAASKDQALSKRLWDQPEEVGREHGLRGAQLVELIGSARYGAAGLAESNRTSRVLLDIRAHRNGEAFPFAGLADAELAERGELAQMCSTQLWLSRGMGSDERTDESLGDLREWASALVDEIRRRAELSDTVDLMLADALIGAKSLVAAASGPSTP